MCVLSRNSGVYPSSLVIQGVDRKGGYIVDGGSFADIWEGVLRSNSVSIKIVRRLQVYPTDEAVKVGVCIFLLRNVDAKLLGRPLLVKLCYGGNSITPISCHSTEYISGHTVLDRFHASSLRGWKTETSLYI